MVSAICPHCHILLVEAKSSSNASLGRAEDTAVRLGARFVSNSWSSTEEPGQSADNHYFNHPGDADRGRLRRQRLRHQLPGRPAVRDLRRRHRADPPAVGHQGLDRDGLGQCQQGRRGHRLGLLAADGQAVLAARGGGHRRRRLRRPDRERRVRRGRPGHRRGRLRHLQDARARGPWSAGPARRPRSSRPPTRWPATRRRAATRPRTPTSTRVTSTTWSSGADGACPAASSYLCQARKGYDGPTGPGHAARGERLLGRGHRPGDAARPRRAAPGRTARSA